MSNAYEDNLDIQCAKLGHTLVYDKNEKKVPGMDEKVLNSALAVLEEQGPYAMFLYLKARHSDVAGDISSKALGFLRGIFRNQLNGENDILNAIKNLSENLDDLLFARDLLRTALSYARYHLKANGGE